MHFTIFLHGLVLCSSLHQRLVVLVCIVTLVRQPQFTLNIGKIQHLAISHSGSFVLGLDC